MTSWLKRCPTWQAVLAIGGLIFLGVGVLGALVQWFWIGHLDFSSLARVGRWSRAGVHGHGLVVASRTPSELSATERSPSKGGSGAQRGRKGKRGLDWNLGRIGDR